MSKMIQIPEGKHELSNVHIEIKDVYKMTHKELISLVKYLIAKKNGHDEMPTIGSLEYGSRMFTKAYVENLTAEKLFNIIIYIAFAAPTFDHCVADHVKEQHVHVISEKMEHLIPLVEEKHDLSDITFEWSDITNRVACIGLKDGITVYVDPPKNKIYPKESFGVEFCERGVGGVDCTEPVCIHKHAGKICYVCNKGLKCPFNNGMREGVCIRKHLFFPDAKLLKTPITLEEKAQTDCRFGIKCVKPDCPFRHYDYNDAIVHSPVKKPIKSCRYGVDCKYHACKYAHPPEHVIKKQIE